MFDLIGFRAINGLAGRWVALDAVFIFGATWLIFVMVAFLAAYVAAAWKTTHFEGRTENAAHAAWAVTIGFVLEHLIGFFWFRARPFVALTHVVKLVDRMPLEKSFPSAHATFAFALAWSLFFHNRRWGGAMLVLACAVALSRVAVGVHYPTDVIGGALTGLFAAAVASPVKKKIEPYLELFPVFRKYKRKEV